MPLVCGKGYEVKLFSVVKCDLTSTIPGHREIKDFLARKICRDLGVPELK